MSLFWLKSIVIYIIAQNVIINSEISCKTLDQDTKSTNLIDIKENQENVSVEPNGVDIRVVMKSNTNPQNLREIIRDEMKSLVNVDCNTSEVDDIDVRKPLTVRSIKDDIQESDLEKKFNYLTNEIRVIKKELDAHRRDSHSTISENINSATKCLDEGNSLGVRYNSCRKSLNKKTYYPRNCNNISGIYEILPNHAKSPFNVLCDMEIRGGGWTHIQKRFDGSQDFSLRWRDYKFGFGNLEGEFWLGLQNIYLMTNSIETTELLIEIVDRDNVAAHAFYKTFSIGPEDQGYTLSRLSGFSGKAGDSLSLHIGSNFSTQDLLFTINGTCATTFHGGWWYKEEGCIYSNLNGQYINIDLPQRYVYEGVHWATFRGLAYCHSKSRMLIRPST